MVSLFSLSSVSLCLFSLSLFSLSSSQLWQVDNAVDNFHNSWPSQEVIHDKAVLKACFDNSMKNMLVCEFICWYNSEIRLVHKPRGPVQWYSSRLRSKISGNQPLDWLWDIWFMAELQNRLLKKQTKNQRSAAR